ncbi:TPA: hypothetical protein HA239_05955 [Candidatus Woesearchaeota archaeon]|nr:hypothetical protein QT06_C0001G1293 [archaeon GW2011_AR15]MBS3104248.1 hypothetical protein [Candidatus Woesearchaeota archaeon]HIH41921.1 hypothetical protein [Candidatus Woesearchaeota archaeon]
MGDIAEYILEHENGGYRIVQAYQQYTAHLAKYLQIIGEMDSLKGTGDWVLGINVPGVGPALTLIDGDEPFIGPMGNAMMHEVGQAKTHLQILVDSHWGNIPLVKKYYGRLMQQPFPENYQGYDIPAEYMIADGKLSPGRPLHLLEG